MARTLAKDFGWEGDQKVLGAVLSAFKDAFGCKRDFGEQLLVAAAKTCQKNWKELDDET